LVISRVNKLLTAVGANNRLILERHQWFPPR
jgi:hypothetical protein